MKLRTCAIIACLQIIAIGSTVIGADSVRAPMGPPPEAFAACNGKNEGAEVQFITPRGETLKGICKQIGNTLAAVPEGGRSGPTGSSPLEKKK